MSRILFVGFITMIIMGYLFEIDSYIAVGLGLMWVSFSVES